MDHWKPRGLKGNLGDLFEGFLWGFFMGFLCDFYFVFMGFYFRDLPWIMGSFTL